MKAIRTGLLLKTSDLRKMKTGSGFRKYGILSLLPLCLTIVAGMVLVFSGCTGPTGPTGPQGYTGTSGPSGVSNIKMQIYALNKANWKRDSSSPGNYFYQDTIFNAQITDQVNDVVTAFYCLKSTMYKWQPLPAVGVFGTADRFSFAWSKYTISFLYDSTANPRSAPDSSIYFDVAVIPPQIVQKHPNMNWKDGKAVLNLPEMQAALQMKKMEY